ncbi:hypothetical protein SteCoe_20425 [Stentor coeruleus]|uniref:Anaphase-promoting complex subunit 4 WD40 domain-containing protein n=1 Tax=Stentor coeruleus TaxID=5963 RepID=A0A1R2BRU5_9CILI|nr:hypothetical protein SteCoe_20425 [Stentor coeruleus]
MEPIDQVIYIGFNQDSSCITLSTEKKLESSFDSSFRVIGTHPLKFCYQRIFPGSFSIVELLNRSNIIALVGGGACSHYPSSKLIIWDDQKLRIISELNFRLEIKSVRLRRNRVVVVLETKVYVFNLQDLKVIDMINTFHNPHGICCMSNDEMREVLVCPSDKKGNALIKVYTEDKEIEIDAHETPLACAALNKDGTLLATASDKGTLIRIFDTETGDLLQELRRGIDRAEIYSLAFHPTSHWIACSSNTGTVHIYSIDPEIQNKKLALKFFKKMLPKYFESEWSFAKFKVKGAKTVCAFAGDELKLMILTDHAMFYEVDFTEGGHCAGEIAVNLLNLELV